MWKCRLWQCRKEDANYFCIRLEILDTIGPQPYGKCEIMQSDVNGMYIQEIVVRSSETLEAYHLRKCMTSLTISLMNSEFHWNVIHDSFSNSRYSIWDKLVEVRIVALLSLTILRKLTIGEVPQYRLIGLSLVVPRL